MLSCFRFFHLTERSFTFTPLLIRFFKTRYGPYLYVSTITLASVCGQSIIENLFCLNFKNENENNKVVISLYRQTRERIV